MEPIPRPPTTWKADPFDPYIPPGGFVSDLVLAGRGEKATTKLTIWTGLFCVSSAVKRRVYLDWGHERFYANLFTMLVAPPSLCGKSTIINRGLSIIRGMDQYLEGRQKATHTVPIFSGKYTPENLLSKLARLAKHPVSYREGKALKKVPGTSQAAVAADELSFLLGRQSYNTGGAPNLLKLYDCRDTDTGSIGRGAEYIKNPYVTIICGTTWKGLEESVTPEALQDGFIDRFVLVHEPLPTRIIPFPSSVITNDQLSQRLAHIARQADGEYKFSDEASRVYEMWYRNVLKGEIEKLKSSGKAHYRIDIKVVKTAFLLRLQRYEPGNEIELDDFRNAVRLVTATLEKTENLLEDHVTKDPWRKKFTRVEGMILNHGEIYRQDLQHYTSKSIRAHELREILSDLKESGKISIFDGDEKKDHPGTKGTELYKWNGT